MKRGRGSKNMSVRAVAPQVVEHGSRGMRNEARVVLGLGVAMVLVWAFIYLMPFQDLYSLWQYSSLATTLATIGSRANGILLVFSGAASEVSYDTETHLMQCVMCAVGGAALGLCGSTYQGAFNNPLAAPKTLGVMSGGALGSLLYILLLMPYVPQMPESNSVTTAQMIEFFNSQPWYWQIAMDYGQCLCSIVGCLLIVGIVVLVASATGKGKLSNISVILTGQVIAVGVTAVIEFFRYALGNSGDEELSDQLAAIENYSFARSYYFHDMLVMVVPIVILIVVIILLRKRFSLLSFGDDEARAMGINPNRLRYVMILLCTLLTALAISFCGHIAFLGFISAHISRRMVGPDMRFLLPASALFGGTFCMVIEWLCNSGLPFTNPYSAAAICSVLGGGLFLFLVVREALEGRHGW